MKLTKYIKGLIIVVLLMYLAGCSTSGGGPTKPSSKGTIQVVNTKPKKCEFAVFEAKEVSKNNFSIT